MPQHFQVLRCYKCSVFQVHQTKKTNKFQCKLCGEKQSIKRHYGVGTGKDCRLHVQKLNGIRGELDELSSSLELNKEDIDEDNDGNQNTKPNVQKQRPNKSKWSDYVEKEVPEVNIEETMYIENKEVVLEVPKKRFKKLGRHFPNKAMKFANSNKLAEDANEIVSSNERVELSVKDSNFSIKSMNIPFSNHTKLESTQNCNVINHTNELQSECENYNLKPSAANKEETLALKTYIPTVVKSNSKWAQFVENDDQEEEDSEQLSPSCDHNPGQDPQTRFSLCDDSDLDHVLAI